MGKNTPKAPKASMPPARQKMISVPMPQLQADKIIGRVEQPLAKHYNGQGLAQASHYLPLSDEDFQPTFEALWDAHVEFGTSRSHKKLLGKRKHEGSALEAGAGVAQPGPQVSGKAHRQHKEETAMSAEASAEPAARIVPAAAPRKPPAESAGAATVASHTLANKGRFAGTLAARLLSGGGGT